FAQILGYEPGQEYRKGIFEDYCAMLRVIDQLPADPARDVQEFVRRLVVLFPMGDTDAHLQYWAMVYPDGVNAVMAPAYDPASVTAFFSTVPPEDYAVDHAIDAKLKAFPWGHMATLLEVAQVPRAPRLLQLARATVKPAQ